ncbi:MAG: hypothetical protein ACOCRZ_02485 [Halothermotrichaceae bacterium]
MEDKIDQLLTGFYNFKKLMEERFDGLEERMGKLEERFDGLEERFDKMEDRVDRLEDNMNKRFGKLDKQYKSFMKDLGTTRRMAAENMRDVEDLDERVEKIEASAS